MTLIKVHKSQISMEVQSTGGFTGLTNRLSLTQWDGVISYYLTKEPPTVITIAVYTHYNSTSVL